MQALSSTGLTREEVYITSAVRSRPYRVTHRINKRTQQSETVYPNRTPTRSEVFAHAPILDYELMKVQPKLIATLETLVFNVYLAKNIRLPKSWSTLYRACLTINRTKGCLRMVRKTIEFFHFSSSSYFLQSLLVPVIHQDWQVLASLLQQY